MKRLKSCLLASAGLITLAAALSLTAPGRAAAQRVKDDCIRICDTASNPLHVIVQGITRVTGDVTINNQNAIATTVTGPVQVRTSPREPLSVIPRLKMDDIFQEQVSLTLKTGDTTVIKDFVVPPGKFLEIKHASGTVMVDGGTGVGFFVFLNVIQPNDNVYKFNLPRTLQDFSNVSYEPVFSNYHVGGHQNGIFGDSGGTVRVVLTTLFPSQAEMKLELVLSGQYHDF